MSELQLGLGLGLGIGVTGAAGIAYSVYYLCSKARKREVAVAKPDEDLRYECPNESAVAQFDPYTNAQVMQAEANRLHEEEAARRAVEANKHAVLALAQAAGGIGSNNGDESDSIAISMDTPGASSAKYFPVTPSAGGPTSGAGAMAVPALAIHAHPTAGMFGAHGTPLPMAGGGPSGAGSGATPFASASVPGAALSGLGSSSRNVEALSAASNLYAGKDVRTARPSTVGRGRRSSINNGNTATITGSHPVQSLTSSGSVGSGLGGADLDAVPSSHNLHAAAAAAGSSAEGNAHGVAPGGAGNAHRTDSVAALVSTYRPHVASANLGDAASLGAQQVLSPVSDSSMLSPDGAAEGFGSAAAETESVSISSLNFHPQEGALLDSAAKAHNITTMQRQDSRGDSVTMFQAPSEIRAVLKASAGQTSRGSSPFNSASNPGGSAGGRESVSNGGTSGRASARGPAKNTSPSASTAASAAAAGATPPFQAQPVTARRSSIGGGIPKPPVQPPAK